MPARFVADSMLGSLAKWLRAFGFDVLYDSSLDDHGVIAQARARGAIALTRDTQFPKPPDVRIIMIESNDVEEQFQQVAQQVPLDMSEVAPLTRCTACNSALLPTTRDDVWDKIPPFVYLTNETYAACPGCGRVYWEGTHVSKMRRQLTRLAAPTAVRNDA